MLITILRCLVEKVSSVSIDEDKVLVALKQSSVAFSLNDS